MHSLLFKQSRADQNSADCKEELYPSVAKILEPSETHAAYSDCPRMVENYRANCDRAPSIQRFDISGFGSA